jgi:hypothetical protein
MLQYAQLARAAISVALVRRLEHLEHLEPLERLETFRFLFAKPAEFVSFDHGAVLSVKFSTVVEVFVHD